MLSPSPTQPPPVPPVLEPKPEEKKVVYTKKRRAGETPAALTIKAVLRPIIKVFYYVLRFAGSHKLISLAMVILFIAGIFGTNILSLQAMMAMVSENDFAGPKYSRC